MCVCVCVCVCLVWMWTRDVLIDATSQASLVSLFPHTPASLPSFALAPFTPSLSPQTAKTLLNSAARLAFHKTIRGDLLPLQPCDGDGEAASPPDHLPAALDEAWKGGKVYSFGGGNLLLIGKQAVHACVGAGGWVTCTTRLAGAGAGDAHVWRGWAASLKDGGWLFGLSRTPYDSHASQHHAPYPSLHLLCLAPSRMADGDGNDVVYSWQSSALGSGVVEWICGDSSFAVLHDGGLGRAIVFCCERAAAWREEGGVSGYWAGATGGVLAKVSREGGNAPQRHRHTGKGRECISLVCG